jgi:hypothetical protein
MTQDLRAAIQALKAMYESDTPESDTPEPTDHRGGSAARRHSPQPRADSTNVEPDAGQAGAGATNARAARAFTALASEHELRLAAEAELERLRHEIERGLAQLRSSMRQAAAAEERAEQVEARLAQLGRGSLRRWAVPSAIALAILVFGWALGFSLDAAHTGSGFVVGSVHGHRGPATEAVPPPNTGQAVAPAARPTGSAIGTAEAPAQPAAGASAEDHQQQTATAAPAQGELPDGKAAAATAVPADAAAKAPADDGPATAEAKVEPRQPEPVATNSANAPASGSVISQLPALAVVPANASLPNGNVDADALAAKVSIHFEQGSSQARTDAQKLAASLALSGFGAAQIRSTQHAIREPLVRYYFSDDAAAAGRIVAELQTQDAKWRLEDCTHYRRKPPVGSIDVWPARSR